MRRSLIAAVCGSLIVGGAAHAGPPRIATGKWVVDFDDAQCVASRNYGTAEAPLYLVIKAPPLGGVMQLGVMRAAKTERDEQVDATMAIDALPPLKVSMLTYTATSAQRRVNLINLAVDQFAPMRQARSLSIASKRLHESFALSSMDGLLKMMDTCVADLVKVWNVTEGDGPGPSLKARAFGNLASVFAFHDYPSDAEFRDNEGTVQFVALIDERGKVADCTVIATSGSASLDAQTCSVLKSRMTYKPAVGFDGKPARDAMIGRVRWVMPK